MQWWKDKIQITIFLLFMKKLELDFELVLVHCHWNYCAIRGYKKEQVGGCVRIRLWMDNNTVLLFKCVNNCHSVLNFGIIKKSNKYWRNQGIGVVKAKTRQGKKLASILKLFNLLQRMVHPFYEHIYKITVTNEEKVNQYWIYLCPWQPQPQSISPFLFNIKFLSTYTRHEYHFAQL